MTLATSWHLSVADSSDSYTALSLMSWRTSVSLRNSSRDGAAHDLVGFGFELVDFLADLEDGGSIGHRGHEAHRGLHALGATQQQLGELRRFGRDLLDVVEHQRFGGVLDEVEHVVHARDQPVDVVAIEGRDEGGVQQLHGLVRDAVGGVLGVLDELDAARRDPCLVVVVAQARRRAPPRLPR